MRLADRGVEPPFAPQPGVVADRQGRDGVEDFAANPLRVAPTLPSGLGVHPRARRLFLLLAGEQVEEERGVDPGVAAVLGRVERDAWLRLEVSEHVGALAFRRTLGVAAEVVEQRPLQMVAPRIDFPLSLVDAAREPQRLAIRRPGEILGSAEDLQRLVQAPVERQVRVLVGVERALLEDLEIDLRMVGPIEARPGPQEQPARDAELAIRREPFRKGEQLGRVAAGAAQNLVRALPVTLLLLDVNVLSQAAFVRVHEHGLELPHGRGVDRIGVGQKRSRCCYRVRYCVHAPPWLNWSLDNHQRRQRRN